MKVIYTTIMKLLKTYILGKFSCKTAIRWWRLPLRDFWEAYKVTVSNLRSAVEWQTLRLWQKGSLSASILDELHQLQHLPILNSVFNGKMVERMPSSLLEYLNQLVAAEKKEKRNQERIESFKRIRFIWRSSSIGLPTTNWSTSCVISLKIKMCMHGWKWGALIKISMSF